VLCAAQSREGADDNLRRDLAPLFPELGSAPAGAGDRTRLFDALASGFTGAQKVILTRLTSPCSTIPAPKSSWYSFGAVACLLLVMSVSCSKTARSDYERVSGNPVPDDYKEEVIWLNASRPAAAALIGLVIAPEQAASDAEQFMGRELEHAGKLPADIDRAAIAYYRSQPFHVSATTRSIRLIDIRSFPALPGASVVVLTRLDWWKGGGREFHTGCRVPFKVWTKTHVVTKGELSSLLTHYERSGLTTVVGFAEYDWDPLRNPTTLSTMRDELLRKSKAN
jgi:hypothetical protein